MATNLNDSIKNNAVGIFDRKPASPAAGNRNARADDYVQADVYLNLGLEFDVATGDGNSATTFVQFPKNLALDVMEPAKEEGTPAWIEAMRARNAVLGIFMNEASKLAPGESRRVELVGYITRRKAPVEKAPVGESPLLSAIAAFKE